MRRRKSWIERNSQGRRSSWQPQQPSIVDVHGVALEFQSHFWATKDIKDDSDGDSISSQELPREAFDAGFTIREVQQAEEELSTLPRSREYKLEEGSLSKQIINTWVSNQRKGVKPWQAPYSHRGFRHHTR
jgi:hypothetical protein